MTTYIFLAALAVAAAVGGYWLFTRRKINPKTAGSGWLWLNSPGMGPVTQEGGWNTFQFVDKGQAHMLVRNTGPLSGRVKLAWKLEGGSVRPVQGSIATVSLIIIRKGNTWQQAEYRFYWAGLTLAGGPTEVDIALDPSYWTNVYGKNDSTQFAACLANAEYVGLAFGDPGAGATAHGVTGTGKFSFTFEIVS